MGVCSKCKTEVARAGQGWCLPCTNAGINEYRKTDAGKASRYKSGGSLSTRYRHLRQRARIRGVSMEISREDFDAITQNSCTYCDHELTRTGSNLDRLDSSVGYLLSNVVPCCADCNMAKGAKWTYEETLKIGAVIRELKNARKAA